MIEDMGSSLSHSGKVTNEVCCRITRPLPFERAIASMSNRVQRVLHGWQKN